MKEMKEEHLLLAKDIATNKSEQHRFRKLMGGDSFWGQLADAREEYFVGIESGMGFPLPPDKRKERHDAFMACAAYLFSGLRSLDEPDAQEIPNISSELIEKMHDHCDDDAKISARHTVLSSGGPINEIWAASFSELLKEHDLNTQGSGLLYGLAMAWISTREREEEMKQRIKAMQATGFLDELDAVLKKVGVGDENQNQGKL